MSSEEGTQKRWSGPLPNRRGLLRAAETMRLLSNPVRLEILCHLLMEGEVGVGSLQEKLKLSQSALSQHLGKLRGHGVVETRRDRQRIFYHIARNDVHEVMNLLRGLYCEPEERENSGN